VIICDRVGHAESGEEVGVNMQTISTLILGFPEEGC
jgi:hypothetical protein